MLWKSLAAGSRAKPKPRPSQGAPRPGPGMADSSGSSFLRDAGLIQEVGLVPGLPNSGNVLQIALPTLILPT